MFKKILLCFVLLLSFLQSKAQDDPDTSKIKRSLENSRPDTNRVLLLLSMGKIYFDNSSNSLERVDTAGVYADKAIALSGRLKYNWGLASGILLKSNVFRKRGDTASAQRYLDSSIYLIKRFGNRVQLGSAYLEVWFRYVQDAEAYKLQMKYFQMALKILTPTGAKIPIANALYNVADLYRYGGDNKKALGYYTQALDIYKQEKYPALYNIYQHVAFVYLEMGDAQTALQYGLISAEIAEKLKIKTLTLSVIYNIIGITYSRQNDDKKALDYFYKALAIAQLNHNEDHIRNLYTNIASMQLRSGSPAAALKSLQIYKKYPPKDVNMLAKSTCMFIKIYLKLKDFKDAEIYYQQLLLIDRDKVASASVRELILMCNINYLQSTGQYKASVPYLKLYEPYWKNSGNSLKESQGEAISFKTDSGLGNFLAAIRHHQRYKILSDSTLDKEKAKQFDQLSLKFETEKKDRELTVKEQRIQILKEQALLQQSVLNHERAMKNGVFAGTILLITLSGVGYSRFRLKQKTNFKLEKQQAEINNKNIELQTLLEEKDWLLKEIHHRVKNNLQIVISLLNTQSSYLDNKDALAAIRNSQYRMHAMSLIHQKLYQSENLGEIDLPAYIKELANYLKISYGDQGVVLIYDLCPLKVDVGHAVPLGLILNEIISNAFKYAFTSKNTGIISISLSPAGNESYKLMVADDGIGLPADFDLSNSDSLGMSLINGLTSQLEGTLELVNDRGLTVAIIFKLTPNIR